MHLNENIILLYLSRYGLTTEKRQQIDEHLKTCALCSERIKQYYQFISRMGQDNQKECQEIETNLVAYHDGQLSDWDARAVDKHLQSCDCCRYLFKTLDQNLGNEWKAVPNRSTAIPDLTDKIKHYLTKIGTLITLIIEPLDLAPVFLGQTSFGERSIEHPGGDLLLNLSQPGKKVRILSNKYFELDSRTSDASGLVTFDDLTAGTYLVQVEGHEITDLQDQTPANPE